MRTFYLIFSALFFLKSITPNVPILCIILHPALTSDVRVSSAYRLWRAVAPVDVLCICANLFVIWSCSPETHCMFYGVVRNTLLCPLLHFVFLCWAFDWSCWLLMRGRSVHFHPHLPLLKKMIDAVSGPRWLTSPTPPPTLFLSLCQHVSSQCRLSFPLRLLLDSLFYPSVLLSLTSFTVLQLFVLVLFSL